MTIETETIYTISELQSAIDNASSDEVIIIPNGTYEINTIINISKSGITIKGQTCGGVIFKSSKISFNITGNNNIIDGIQFINTSANMTAYGGTKINLYDLITINGSNNTISNINIDNVYAKHFFNVYGGTQNNKIVYCNIENKPMDDIRCLDSMIKIQDISSTIGFHNISYCSFHNMSYGTYDDYNCEPICLGDNQYNLGTIVEHCVFDNTHLSDCNIILVNSMYNVIRYNTFSNNNNGYINFNSSNNYIYGNFFINSSGIRVYESSNIYVYNNYFSGYYPPFILADISGFYQSNINLVNNTFYRSCGLYFGSSDISNNIITNNIFYKTTIIGDISNNMFGTNLNDPNMIENSKGYYSIENSISVSNNLSLPENTYIDVDNNIQLDITGLKRSINNDIGCNNFNNLINPNHVNYLRTIKYVGPSYLMK